MIGLGQLLETHNSVLAQCAITAWREGSCDIALGSMPLKRCSLWCGRAFTWKRIQLNYWAIVDERLE